MSYELWLEGGATRARLTLLPDDHDQLADAIVRGAGTVRLLRRIVDADRAASFLPAEVPLVLHELSDLRSGLATGERDALAAEIDRLEGLFAQARRAGAGVKGEGR